ncbi:MAG TPA: DUF58 domain-containing protein [Pyrinomonadaceae bacterium]|nr:DUF58 domain-containing protein [Pyrinomonadaceae bacterium]
MKFRTLTKLFSFRDIRNAILGISVVIAGLGLAFLTLWAQQIGDNRLAGFAAGASLVFVLLIFVFVVPPLARSASAEASQMNLPFEFTVGGAAILGLIVIVGFSAWNTGNNLLFLVLSLMVASLVVGFVAGNVCLKKLDVKMRFPETIFAAEPTPILVSLHNRKRVFPTFSVVAQVRGNERETSALFDEVKEILPAKWAEKITRPPIVRRTLDYFVFVPRRDSVENKTEHIFENRGRFIINDFELSTKFPFGFFRHRRRLSAQEAEIVIFPKLVSINEQTMDLPPERGNLVANKKGLGQDLLSLRDYQPMDDLRRVDWRATARAQRLIVREFSAEDDKRVTVIFDTHLPAENNGKKLTLREKIEAEQKGKKLSPVSEKFENGISQTASLLAHFADEQAEIRLIVDENIGEFGIGRQHLNECLKRLALVEPRFDETAAGFSGETLEEIFTERENSYTFFVTAQTEENLSSELIQRAKIVKY